MKSTFEEQACLYVLDELDPQERAIFEARLNHDGELAELVRQLEQALEHEVRSLPEVEPSDTLLGKIELEIDRHRVPAPRRFPWISAARWGLAAMIAVSVGILAVQSLRGPANERPALVLVGLSPSGITQSELPVEARSSTPDGRFAQLASLAERMWADPRHPSPGRGPAVDGTYALFDPETSQGFISVGSLPAAAEGKSYRLWVLDTRSGILREAGAIPLNGGGRGLYFFSVDPMGTLNSRRNLTFFVTVEDSAERETASPRGKVVLGKRGI